MVNNKKEHIKYYAYEGLEIFPCNDNKKTPLTKHGFKDASADERVINSWWDKYPDANIGYPLERQIT